MIGIDLDRLAETVKQINGSVLITKYYDHPAIKCTAKPTDLQYEDDRIFEKIKADQKAPLKETFLEFYVETQMVEWYIFLKVPLTETIVK